MNLCPHDRITNELPCIITQQNCYPRNYIITNQHSFGHPQTLAPTDKKWFHRIYFELVCSALLLCLSCNVLLSRYFRRPINIFCEFIPQIVFLLCLFGYLVALVFYKWIFFTSLCTQYAPQLLIRKSLAYLFLFSNDCEWQDLVNYLPCTKSSTGTL